MRRNEKNDKQPLFLSADHCSSAFDLNTASFRFRHFSSNENFQAERITFSGAITLANGASAIIPSRRDKYSDFILLSLKQEIKPEHGLVWAGWTRSKDAPTQLTVLHHPKSSVGGVSLNNTSMRVAFDNGPITRTLGTVASGDIASGLGTQGWTLILNGTGDFGMTAPGSSGSAAFNQNHHIQGTLSGGNNTCSNVGGQEWYGAFDAHWSGGGLASNSLRPHIGDDISVNGTFLCQVSPSQLRCSGQYLNVKAPRFVTVDGEVYKYVWSYSPNLQLISENDNETTFAPISRPQNPSNATEWVKCQIFNPTPCGFVMVAERKEIINYSNEVASPICLVRNNGREIYNGGNICLGSHTLNAFIWFGSLVPIPSNYILNWSVSGSAGFTYALSSNRTLELNIYRAGTIQIRVNVIQGAGSCETSSERVFFLNAQQNGCTNIINPPISENNRQVQTPNISANMRLKVFPNPISSGQLFLDIKGTQIGETNEIQLLDLNGRVLESMKSQNSGETIPTHNLPNGVYWLRVTNSQSSQSARFVVQK